MNMLKLRYDHGLSALDALTWPSRFRLVADALGVKMNLLHRVAIRTGARENRSLTLAEAEKAWKYIVAHCWSVIREALRGRPSEQDLLPLLDAIPAWPCSHRAFAEAVGVSHPTAGRYARGADISKGISRQVAEEIIRNYSHVNPAKAARHHPHPQRPHLSDVLPKLDAVAKWPCSHRELARAVGAPHVMPSRNARGADISKGITRQVAEEIVRNYCRA